VVYRHYATLYFIFIVDRQESDLGILDLIQVCVSPNSCFFVSTANDINISRLCYIFLSNVEDGQLLHPSYIHLCSDTPTLTRCKDVRAFTREIVDPCIYCIVLTLSCTMLWQVFVEALDKCFENVCELDIIFHSDKVFEGLGDIQR